MTESIALFGGPKDGELIAVEDCPPLEYQVAIGFFPGMPSRMRLGTYAPRCSTYGVVECDHAGHPIYEWKGEQHGEG